MNFDAVLLFYKKIEALDYDEKDILLMSSAVLNKSIDINLSVRDNMLKYAEIDKNFNPDKYLNDDLRNCDVPIYRILLQDDAFFNLLLDAMGKNILNSESIKDILECYMDAVDKLSEKETSRVLTYIIQVLAVNFRVDAEVMKESKIFREFVKNNLFALSMPKKKRNDSDVVAKKMIIIKLFRLGFVEFGLREDILINYEEVIQPLIDTHNYGQVKLIIFKDNVLEDDLDHVHRFIIDGIDDNYASSSIEDREYGEKCKKDIDLIFNIRRERIKSLRNV